ncbi:mannose/fructose/sorbose PTS transporter subunit IID [Clostridium sp. JN-9]|uniref:mannose/fructose/sorbose PTS transporter subunit IID n=1 Tax=Clostridium sp. JN-9 TaxID=2507159 RepID=UPI000FFDFC87|nr:mannose/fructose/sorbose PTS transporter subunit IID [Clostridium sp. JN-9]QAT39171.1 hypothetical protein EQM05_02250 [Clostridium sp. JN-9]
MSIKQTVLLIVFTSISGIGSSTEEFQTHRPLIAATLIGIALGDIKSGVIVGSQMELIALGWMTIGVATPLDATLSSIVAAILVILGKQQIGVAIGIAVPFSAVGQLMFIVQKGIIDVAIMHWAENGVERGQLWKVTTAHFLTAIPSIIRITVPSLIVAYFANITSMRNFLNLIPKTITIGLQISSGFLVVVGYAMILRMLNQKEMLSFFFMGFLVMTFSNITLLGLTLLGLSLAMVYYQISNMIDKGNNRNRRTENNTANLEKKGEKTKIEITKKDLMKVFWRSQFFQLSWNYERLQNLCYCYCIMPILKKLYKQKEELQSAVKSHLEYFNTQPFFSSAIIGADIAFEETMVNGQEFDTSSIARVKLALMGPMAGIGDPIIWGIVRPVTAAIGAGIASNGNILGPIFFFAAMNTVRLFMRYNVLMIAYREGTNIITKLKGILPKLKNSMAVLTYTIIGGLVAKWTVIKVPFVLYSINSKNGVITATVQQQLDSIMPNILPLMLTFFVYWLLKKKVSPMICMFGLMILGIAGYALGFLGL